MKVKELVSVTVDKVILYEATDAEDYEDIYKGEVKNIPLEIMEKEVRIFGTAKKGVIDIQVS